MKWKILWCVGRCHSLGLATNQRCHEVDDHFLTSLGRIEFSMPCCNLGDFSRTFMHDQNGWSNRNPGRLGTYPCVFNYKKVVVCTSNLSLSGELPPSSCTRLHSTADRLLQCYLYSTSKGLLETRLHALLPPIRIASFRLLSRPWSFVKVRLSDWHSLYTLGPKGRGNPSRPL